MDDIVGYGFRPTDQELVDFYLKHKLLDDDSRVHRIPVIDLCDVEPSDVPGKLKTSPIRFGDPDWFFFSPVDFKYSNSKRVNRKTKCGFWKATGKDRDIRSWDTNTLIATKKTLVYYKGNVSRGVKSNWVIHEYHAVTFHESKRTFVLCRLMSKPGKTTEVGADPLICDEGDPSKLKAFDFENQATTEGTPSGGSFSGVETIFQTTPQAETHFYHNQKSPIEEPYFPNYPFNNVCFRNENNFTHDEFWNLAEEYFAINEETDQPASLEKDVTNQYYNHTSKRFKSNDVSSNQEIKFIKKDPFLNQIEANESLTIEETYQPASLEKDVATDGYQYLNHDECHTSKRYYNEYSSDDECHTLQRFKSDDVSSNQEIMYRDNFWIKESSLMMPQQIKNVSMFEDNFWELE